MVGENFKIYCPQFNKKCIWESKNWIYTFLLMGPQAKRSPQGSYYHSPGRQKLLIPSKLRFFEKMFPPAETSKY